MKSTDRRSLAEVPEPVDDYHDAEGFVFPSLTEAEAEALGLRRMTAEQKAAVQPLTKFDLRRFEANEKRKAAL